MGYGGFLQSIADAVKLFFKDNLGISWGMDYLYSLSSLMFCSIRIILWVLYPFIYGWFRFNYSILFFLSVRGMGVFPLFLRGWSSNSKYAILGSTRGVAQLVTYEVTMIIVLLCFFYIFQSFCIKKFFYQQNIVINFFLLGYLRYIWIFSVLAERNRTPYDFSEGESELVSGFNTEYGGGGFILFFVGEYRRILFLRLLRVLLLFGIFNINLIFIIIIIYIYIFIWIRGTLPRYRYDKLIGLAWVIFVPSGLLIIIYYYILSLYLCY